MKTSLVLLSLYGLAARVSAVSFSVGGFTWDSDNAVTAAAFTEGGPGFIAPTSFPEGSRSVGNLLNGTSPGFVDITNTITNTDRATLTMNWSAATNGALLPNLAGHDLVIYETGSLTAPEAYAVSVRNAQSGIFSSYYYFYSDSFDTAAS